MNPSGHNTGPGAIAFHGALPIPLSSEERVRWQAQFNEWPSVKQFGLRMDLVHPVACRFVLDELQPYHLGGVGDAGSGGGRAINGGIIAGMFDGALGVAGAVQLAGRRAGTVDLSIKLFRAVVGGATMFGWAVKKSGPVVFVEAVLLDRNGTRCASASGIVCGTNLQVQSAYVVEESRDEVETGLLS